MRIEFTVDGKYYTLSVSSDKPLNLLLSDDLEIKSTSFACGGRMCGLCVVLMDGKAVLSCLVPAFEVRGKTITTFDGFSKTRDYRDIEKAYSSMQNYPCDRCRAARSLLIESIVRRYEVTGGDFDSGEVLAEAALIDCDCMDSDGFLKVVRESILNRRKRKNVRRA